MLLPDWYPNHPPVYDPEKSYAENAEFGPFFSQPFPTRPPPKKWEDFLGFSVSSRIGVPAGPLLNSRWIEFAAKLGFDILIYKTIRSAAFPGHPPPNILYVKRIQNDLAYKLEKPPDTIESLTITNSFGMPSKSPEFLMEDIERANKSLAKGQVLIVSVTASTGKDNSFLEDFVETACLAKNAGAKIIEANLSCPNVGAREGALYTNAESVYEFASQIAKAIHPVPLILKVGKFSHERQLKDVLLAAARAGARAFSGLNSVSIRVLDHKKEAALGNERPTSGICGSDIRKEALEFTHSAKEIIRKEKLDLVLIGVGGIMKPQHFDLFFENGADFALSATGMMWDPYLALRYHYQKGTP